MNYKTLILLLLFIGFQGGVSAQGIAEGFNSSTFPPAGWTVELVSGSKTWELCSMGLYPPSPTHDGDGMARYNSYHARRAESAILISPSVTPTENGWVVVFHMYRSNHYGSYGSANSDTLNVYANQTPSLVGATSLISVLRHTNSAPISTVNGWHEFSVALPDSFTGQAIYVLFEARSAYQGDIYLDDISIAPPPTCPHVTGLSYRDLSHAQLTLDWTENSTANQWIAKINNKSDSLISEEILSNRPATLSLSATTKYTISIRPICGVGDTGNYSNEITFITPQIAATVPFQEDFEDDATHQLWQTLSSHNSQWNFGSAVSGYGVTSAKSVYLSQDGGVHSGVSNDPTKAYLWRDIDFGNIDSVFLFSFDFKMENTSTSSWNYPTVTCHLVDPNREITTGTPWWNISRPYHPVSEPMGYIAERLVGDSTWRSFACELRNVSGVKRLLFYFSKGNSVLSIPPAIDNIALRALHCFAPDSLKCISSTDHSATIRWHERGNASQWEVSVSADENVWTTHNVTEQEFEIPSLLPNTIYSVKVKAECGGESSLSSAIIKLRTTQISAQLPFNCYFESDETDLANWTFNNADATNQWHIGSATNNTAGGMRSLYISEDSGASHTYHHSRGSLVTAFRDIAFGNAPEYIISFDWKCKGMGRSDFFKALLTSTQYELLGGTPYSSRLNFYSDETDFTDVIPAEYPGHLSAMNGSSQWKTVQAIISGESVTDSIKRLAFVWYNDNYFGENPPAAIDNISIRASYCVTPRNLVVSNISQSEASLQWDHSTVQTWTISLNDTLSNTTTILSTTGNHIVLDNLQANRLYFVKVQANCSNNEESLWSKLASFTTLCDIATLPVQENFEQTSVGAFNNPNTPSCWTFLSDAAAEDIQYFVTDLTAATGNKGFKMRLHRDDLESPSLAGLASPPIDNEINQMQISFHAKNYSYVGNVSQQYLHIGYLTNISDPQSFVLVDTVLLSSDFDTVYTCSFDTVMAIINHPSIGIFIGDSTVRNSNINHLIYVDNINISLRSTCPLAASPSLDSITSESVRISYVLPTNVSEIILEYKAENGSWTASAPVNENPFILSHLQAATTYEIRIANMCDNAGQGNWSIPVVFRTKQRPAQIPYHCNFEDSTENKNWDLTDGGAASHWFIDSAVYNGNAGNALFVSENGNNNSYVKNIYATITADRLLHLEAGKEYELSFDWKCGGESSEDYFKVMLFDEDDVLRVGRMNYLWAKATESNNVIAKNGNKHYFNESNGWQTTTCRFSSNSSQNGNHKLVFVWRNNSAFGSDPAAAIDNIHITEVACSTPLRISANNISETHADISWLQAGNVSSWEFSYSADGSTWNNDIISQNPYAFAIESFSSYRIRIRAICSSTDTSQWSNTFLLKPFCSGVVSHFPFQENFNNGVGCFIDSAIVGNTLWEIRGQNAYFTPGEGDSAALYVQYSDGHQAMLISPLMNTTSLSNPTLSFMYQQKSWGVGIDELNVFYRTHPDSLWHSIKQYSEAQDTWVTDTLALPNPSTSYQIGFKSTSNNGGGVAIDNVIIGESVLPVCLPPDQLSVIFPDSHSARLTWNSPATAMSWLVWLNDSLVGTTTQTAFDFTGLSTHTSYEAKVRAICTLSDSSTTVNHRFTLPAVAQTPATLPYVCNFESTDLRQSWALANGNAENTWFIGAEPDNTTNNCLFISNDYGITNSYTKTRDAGVGAYRDITFGNEDNFVFAFDWKCLGGDMKDYFKIMLIDTTYQIQGGNTYADWILLGLPSAIYLTNETNNYFDGKSTWTHSEIEMDGSLLKGKTKRMIIAWLNDDQDGGDPPAALDNFSIHGTNCKRPSHLTATTSSNAITLNWSENGTATQWIVSWRTMSETSWTDSIVNAQPFTFNAPSGTTCEVKVKAFCNTDNTSAWSDISTFTTECGVFNTPFSEDFSSTSVPSPCWKTFHGLCKTTGTRISELQASTQSWKSTASLSGIASAHAQVIILGDNSAEWLIAPPIIRSQGNEELSFTLAITSLHSTTPSASETDDRFRVLISNDGILWKPENGVLWTPNATDSLSLYNIPQGGKTYRIPLSAYGDTVHIAFYAQSTDGALGNQIHIDNVKINNPSIITKGIVETNDPEIISSNAFRMKGKVIYTGENAQNIKIGFVWTNIQGNPSVNDMHKVEIPFNNNVDFGYLLDNIEAGKEYHYQAFIENEAGISYGAMKSIQPLGIDNVKNKTEKPFTIVPNPARNRINIIVNEIEGRIKIRIVDLFGKIVVDETREYAPENQSTTIDIQKLIPGLYNVIIRCENYQHSQKLIVQ